jgi:hypothetical protein
MPGGVAHSGIPQGVNARQVGAAVPGWQDGHRQDENWQDEQKLRKRRADANMCAAA